MSGINPQLKVLLQDLVLAYRELPHDIDSLTARAHDLFVLTMRDPDYKHSKEDLQVLERYHKYNVPIVLGTNAVLEYARNNTLTLEEMKWVSDLCDTFPVVDKETQ